MSTPTLHRRNLRVKPPLELSPREREVLTLLGTGLKTRAVAAILGLSPKTVSVHLTHVKNKLKARTVFEIGFKARLKLDTGAPAFDQRSCGLTKNEFRVFEILLTGASFKEICNKLCLAETTVERHLSNLRTKCGAKTTFQLGWLAHQFLE